MMKERPILMSAQMVRAILEGRKTVTRRIVKPQPERCSGAWFWEHRKYNNGDGATYFHTESISQSIIDCMVKCCPYGQVGDRLWVREKFAELADDDGIGCIVYAADGSATTVLAEDEGEGDWVALDRSTKVTEQPKKWKSPIHMPRWASRITLEVTSVGVERLQKIGIDGRKATKVKAEGLLPQSWHYLENWFHIDDCPAIQFGKLWDEINGKGSWDANPWVWVIGFRRHIDEASTNARRSLDDISKRDR